MAGEIDIDPAAIATKMPPAQLSAVEAKLKEKYGDDVPTAVQNAIFEAVKMLENAIEEAPTSSSGSHSSSTQNINSVGLPLPPELRNRIYSLCLDEELHEHDIGVYMSPNHLLLRWVRPMRFSPLTQVNREMRNDTLSYYPRNITITTSMRISNRLHRFLSGPGSILIPRASLIIIHGANSNVKIEIAKSSQNVETFTVRAYTAWTPWKLHFMAREDARKRGMEMIEKEMQQCLMGKILRPDGNTGIPVDVFRKVFDIFWAWDEEKLMVIETS